MAALWKVDELKAEILRVRAAAEKTKSPQLKRDYGKHAARLEKQLREYEAYMRQR